MAISERVKVNGEEDYFYLKVEEDRSFEDEENRFVKDVKRVRNGKSKSHFKMESWRKSMLSFSPSLDSMDLKGKRESLLSGISSGDSSISWAEDAVENEFTEKLKVLWNNIEGVCGNEGKPSKPDGMSLAVFNECLDWRRAFPQQNILTFKINDEERPMSRKVPSQTKSQRHDPTHLELLNAIDRITSISIPPTPVLTPSHQRVKRNKGVDFGPQLVQAWLTACDKAEKDASPLYEYTKPKADLKRDKFPKPPSPRPRRTNGSNECLKKNPSGTKRFYSAIPPRPNINPENFFSALAFVEKIQDEKLPLRTNGDKSSKSAVQKPKENSHSFLDFVPEFDLKPSKTELEKKGPSIRSGRNEGLRTPENKPRKPRIEEMPRRESVNNLPTNWSRHHSPQHPGEKSNMESEGPKAPEFYSSAGDQNWVGNDKLNDAIFQNIRRPRPNFLQLRKTDVGEEKRTVSPFLFWLFDRVSPL